MNSRSRALGASYDAERPYGGSRYDPWNLDPMYFQKQFSSKQPSDDKPWTAGDWGVLAGLVLLGGYILRGGNFRPRREDRLEG